MKEKEIKISQDDDKREKTSVSMRPSLKTRAGHVKADTGRTLSDLVEEGLLHVLSESTPSSGAEPPEPPLKNPAEMNKSSGILAGISEEARKCIAALQQVLESEDQARKLVFDILDSAVAQEHGKGPIVPHEALEIRDEGRLPEATELAKELAQTDRRGGKKTAPRHPKRRAG